MGALSSNIEGEMIMKKQQKTFRKAETLVCSIFLGCIITIVFLWLFSGFNNLLTAPLGNVETYMNGLLGGDSRSVLWSLLAAQLSLTFISISVLSILSDKDHVIYWKDLVEERLLSPRFCCFAAFTYYSETTAAISCVAVFCNCSSLFFFSFVINLIVLILLTDSILDVYFSKEKHCKKMEKELRQAYEAAFKVPYNLRNDTHYNKIMAEFSIQIQRHRDDAGYLRRAFELIYNNIELFDTTNHPVREVMQYQFNNSGANIDLHPFRTVLAQAEAWTNQMKNGEKNVIYTADWLFWTVAVEKWKKTECFSSVHSHSIEIKTLLELESILNRRLCALIECEKMLAQEDERQDFTLPEESRSKIYWVKDKYFYLLQALFGGYVALYAKRLQQYHDEVKAGKIPWDQNVYKCFPKDAALLSQLVTVMSNYNDINTQLHTYGPEVIEQFLSL